MILRNNLCHSLHQMRSRCSEETDGLELESRSAGEEVCEHGQQAWRPLPSIWEREFAFSLLLFQENMDRVKTRHECLWVVFVVIVVCLGLTLGYGRQALCY